MVYNHNNIIDLCNFTVLIVTQCSVLLLQAEKRAHHNALERKRRDHIKESFHSLRDSVPSLLGEKVLTLFLITNDVKR